MKCPECMKLGMESKVFEGAGRTTGAYYPPFYDEDGKYHTHNGNHRAAYFHCSNGHGFFAKIDPPLCPTCGEWWKCLQVI